MRSVKTWVPARLRRAIRRVMRPRPPRRPARLYGFREFCATTPTRRALVSYLVTPLLARPADREHVAFSNLGIAQYIPRALNELGYEVDIVEWDDPVWQPERAYDLYVGHAGINFQHIAEALPAEATRIYFSTGIYWREANLREARRVYELAQRRGVLLNPDRPIRFSEEYANRSADGIICLGNQNAVRSYAGFPVVIGIRNAVFPLERPPLLDERAPDRRKHFLFFSGSGNLHKGLDLLLEAFAGTDLHLHVCQEIDAEFERAFHAELSEYPNIHVHGYTAMRSEAFERIAAQCRWTISATACEGQPGAVLECMAYGLVPILPAEANIDLEDFGLPLPDVSTAGIRRVVAEAANMAPDECARRARRSAAAIRSDYTPDQFDARFKEAVLQITARSRKGR